MRLRASELTGRTRRWVGADTKQGCRCRRRIRQLLCGSGDISEMKQRRWADARLILSWSEDLTFATITSEAKGRNTTIRNTTEKIRFNSTHIMNQNGN